MTCVHDLHLKPISHSVAVSIQETSSQLTDELPVYNSIQYKWGGGGGRSMRDLGKRRRHGLGG